MKLTTETDADIYPSGTRTCTTVFRTPAAIIAEARCRPLTYPSASTLIGKYTRDSKASQAHPVHPSARAAIIIRLESSMSPPESAHDTLWCQRGAATSHSADAVSIPFHPWPVTFDAGRASTRTHVPASLGSPIDRRLRTAAARSRRTPRERSTRVRTTSWDPDLRSSLGVWDTA